MVGMALTANALARAPPRPSRRETVRPASVRKAHGIGSFVDGDGDHHPPLPRNSAAANLANSGNSALQGGHHVAQKWRTTTFPLSD